MRRSGGTNFGLVNPPHKGSVPLVLIYNMPLVGVSNTTSMTLPLTLPYCMNTTMTYG